MTTYTLTTKINFGKYKGKNETIRELIETDPDLIAWYIDNVEWFELDEQAEAELDAVLGIGEQLKDILPDPEDVF